MIAGFILGARNDDLIRRLHVREGLPSSMAELMAAARAFIRAEESVKNKQDLEKKDYKRLSTERDCGRWDTQKRFKQSITWMRPPNQHVNNNYRRMDPHAKPITNISKNPLSFRYDWEDQLLKTPREVFLKEKLDLQPPRPMNPDSSGNKNKYCEYHKDVGHRNELKLASQEADRPTHTIREIGPLNQGYPGCTRRSQGYRR